MHSVRIFFVLCLMMGDLAKSRDGEQQSKGNTKLYENFTVSLQGNLDSAFNSKCLICPRHSFVYLTPYKLNIILRRMMETGSLPATKYNILVFTHVYFNCICTTIDCMHYSKYGSSLRCYCTTFERLKTLKSLEWFIFTFSFGCRYRHNL